VRTLYDLDDRALATATPVRACAARHHAISVQHLAHFMVTDEQILARRFGNEESVTVRMPYDAASDQIEFPGTSSAPCGF